jgi:hypothetical protein
LPGFVSGEASLLIETMAESLDVDEDDRVLAAEAWCLRVDPVCRSNLAVDFCFPSGPAISLFCYT